MWLWYSLFLIYCKSSLRLSLVAPLKENNSFHFWFEIISRAATTIIQCYPGVLCSQIKVQVPSTQPTLHVGGLIGQWKGQIHFRSFPCWYLKDDFISRLMTYEMQTHICDVYTRNRFPLRPFGSQACFSSQKFETSGAQPQARKKKTNDCTISGQPCHVGDMKCIKSCDAM